MEKSKNKNIELEPFVADYEVVLNEVYLGLAREKDLPNAFEAKDIDTFLSINYPEEKERANIMAELGADFDRGIVDLICNAMLFRRQSLVLKIQANEGLGEDGYLPWVNKIDERLINLKKKGTLAMGVCFAVEREPLLNTELTLGESSNISSDEVGEVSNSELVAA